MLFRFALEELDTCLAYNAYLPPALIGFGVFYVGSGQGVVYS